MIQNKIETRENNTPHQKMQQGMEVLTDAELLAAFGCRGNQKIALGEGEKLLDAFGNLRSLLNAEREELRQVDDTGDAKYTLLQVCLELNKRVLRDSRLKRRRVLSGTSDEAYPLLLSKLRTRGHEVLAVLFLNKSRQQANLEDVLQGCIDSTVISQDDIVRKVFNRASQNNATALVVAHYGPEGDGSPRPVDLSLSQLLMNHGSSSKVRMLDYLVVNNNHHVSMVKQGFLKFEVHPQ